MKEDDNSNIAELEYKLYNTVHMINSGDYSIMFAMTNLFTFINEKGEVDVDFMRDLQKMPAYISGKITGQQNGFFPYSLNSIIETRLMHQLVDDVPTLYYNEINDVSKFIQSITQFVQSKKRNSENYSVDRIVKINNISILQLFGLDIQNSIIQETINILELIVGMEVLIVKLKDFSQNSPEDPNEKQQYFYTEGKKLYTEIMEDEGYPLILRFYNVL